MEEELSLAKNALNVLGGKVEKVDNTEAADIVRLNATQTLTNKTIDADDNTITDCNNMYQEGKLVTYCASRTEVSNLPNTDHDWYIIAQCNPTSWSPNNYVTQIATSGGYLNSNETYTRHGYLNNNTIVWTAWVKLTTTTDLLNCQRQRLIEVYSSNIWSTGYWNILTVSSYAVTGNHDVAVSGIFTHKGVTNFGYPRKFFFQIAVRGQNTNIFVANFTMLKLSGSSTNFGLIATRKATGTRFIINLYIPITENWARDTIKVTDLMVGDVYPTTPLIDGPYSGNLTLQDTHVASIPTDETQITLTNLN